MTDFADIPQVTILYITEYDALHNGQMITHVKRCMETREGFGPIDDGEEYTFHVPYGEGRYWTVFEYNTATKRINVINEMNSHII